MQQLNPEYAAVIICVQCGSNRVDVTGWIDKCTARFTCSACQHEGHVNGFTIGRVLGAKVTAVLPDALKDAALPEFGLLADGEAERHAS